MLSHHLVICDCNNDSPAIRIRGLTQLFGSLINTIADKSAMTLRIFYMTFQNSHHFITICHFICNEFSVFGEILNKGSFGIKSHKRNFIVRFQSLQCL